MDHAYRLRFAREGETLNFRLPDEYAQRPSWQAMSGERVASEHYHLGRPESANAQGVARTEEMVLYLADSGVEPEQALRVMQGLDDTTLRAVVDPKWMAASGAFGRIHHKDEEKYPEAEAMYDLICRAPAKRAERLGNYGMWVFGDYAAWPLDLDERASSPYRALHKNHHGWPICWLAYARSGDAQFFRLADAAARQMVDANFCYYASEEVHEAVGGRYQRRQGWWNRSLLPWAGMPYRQPGPGTRFYAVECDYLWHSNYITGARRGKDVALLFADRIQADDSTIVNSNRVSQSILSSSLDMYQATFDPWFLLTIHTIGEIYTRNPDREGNWRPATEKLIAYTADPRLIEVYKERGRGERGDWGHEQARGWARNIAPEVEVHAMRWRLAGE